MVSEIHSLIDDQKDGMTNRMANQQTDEVQQIT